MSGSRADGFLPSFPSNDSEPIRVLHVDDDAAFGDLVALFLERANERLVVESVSSAREAMPLLDGGSFDCVVSDYRMPETNGLELFDAVRLTSPDLPFVLFTGQGSEEIASEALSRGISEYMQKRVGRDQFPVLANRIVSTVGRRRAERRASNERRLFRAVFEQASDAMLVADDGGELLDANPAACALFDRSREDLLATTGPERTVVDYDFDSEWDSFKRADSGRGLFPVRRPDGTVRVAEYVANRDILPGTHLSVLREVSHRREFDESDGPRGT